MSILKLEAAAGAYPDRVLPNDGEQVGIDLIGLARAMEAKIGSGIGDYEEQYNRRFAAIYRDLAADAYQIASGASIGHNRAERYDAAADAARAAAKAHREKIEALRNA